MFCPNTWSKLSCPWFEFSFKVMGSNPCYLLKSLVLYFLYQLHAHWFFKLIFHWKGINFFTENSKHVLKKQVQKRLHNYFSPLCELETKAGRGGVGHITWFRSKCQRNRLGQVSPQINFWAIFNMNSQFETILTSFFFFFYFFFAKHQGNVNYCTPKILCIALLNGMIEIVSK